MLFKQRSPQAADCRRALHVARSAAQALQFLGNGAACAARALRAHVPRSRSAASRATP
ncbi:MAG TPA: hypothetical protein VK695_14665 [Steroidobacteraceae bacterium]|nr:hypothetical protein [Steroidobacteraceae bacterium]